MREILFRGKREDNGEWVCGYYCHCVYAMNGGKTYPAIQQTDDGSLCFREIIPETVGQYTGLTDKNGKKIFEGDILRGFGGGVINTPRIVRWDERYFSFNCPLAKEHWAFGRNDCPLCLIQGEIAEVIGNIYDNPELLGGADNG